MTKTFISSPNPLFWTLRKWLAFLSAFDESSMLHVAEVVVPQNQRGWDGAVAVPPSLHPV